MTVESILLIVNLVVVSGIALWQRRQITSLQDQCLSKTHAKLLAKVFELRCAKVEERQEAVDAAMKALPATLAGQFKMYVRRDALAKLENSIDTRIADAVALALAPADKAHKTCSRCNRDVARYEEVLGAVICANCNYKSEHK